MKLIRKLFRYPAIVLAIFLMYSFVLHSGLTPCCSCGSGNSHVSNADVNGIGCTNCADTHERNMNAPGMALSSSSSHGHNCVCNEITVSNVILENHEIYYQSTKPDRYHFSSALSVDTIPDTFGLSFQVLHFFPSLTSDSTNHSIRTIVLLS